MHARTRLLCSNAPTMNADDCNSTRLQGEPFAFDSFMFVAKTYTYVDTEEGAAPRKQTKEYANPDDEQFAEVRCRIVCALVFVGWLWVCILFGHVSTRMLRNCLGRCACMCLAQSL